jgi:hypothetical protein
MAETLALDYVREAMSNMNFDFCCSHTHPGVTCNGMAIMMLLRGLKPVIRTYLPVHIVPFLLFKRKKFMKKYAPPHSVPSSNSSNSSWVFCVRCYSEWGTTPATSGGAACSSATPSTIEVSG